LASLSHANQIYAQIISPPNQRIPVQRGNVLRDEDRQINSNQPPSPAPTQNSNSVQPTPVNPGSQGQGNILRDDDRTINRNQPSLSPPSPINLPQGTILRDDDRQINQTQLPWLLFSNQRNQTVPLTIRDKISVFLTREGLTPVSCSSNSVVIISVNNIYVACTSPTEKFPPGTYNTNIPNLESVTQ
jgi:hypothetical protein